MSFNNESEEFFQGSSLRVTAQMKCSFWACKKRKRLPKRKEMIPLSSWRGSVSNEKVSS